MHHKNLRNCKMLVCHFLRAFDVCPGPSQPHLPTILWTYSKQDIRKAFLKLISYFMKCHKMLYKLYVMDCGLWIVGYGLWVTSDWTWFLSPPRKNYYLIVNHQGGQIQQHLYHTAPSKLLYRSMTPFLNNQSSLRKLKMPTINTT